MGTVFSVAIGVITVYALFIGGVILWAWLSKDGEPPQAEELKQLLESLNVEHIYYDPTTNEIFVMDYRLEFSPEVAVYLGTL